MDEARFKKLLDKEWMGPRLAKFWKDHGYDAVSLEKETKLTNLSRYASGKAFPSMQNLAKIAYACKVDLITVIQYLDPGEPIQLGSIEIPVEHRKLLEHLATILEYGSPQMIAAIAFNLQQSAEAAKHDPLKARQG